MKSNTPFINPLISFVIIPRPSCRTNGSLGRVKRRTLSAISCCFCSASRQRSEVQLVDSDGMKIASCRTSGSGVVVWCDALSTCRHCCLYWSIWSCHGTQQRRRILMLIWPIVSATVGLWSPQFVVTEAHNICKVTGVLFATRGCYILAEGHNSWISELGYLVIFTKTSIREFYPRWNLICLQNTNVNNLVKNFDFLILRYEPMR